MGQREFTDPYYAQGEYQKKLDATKRCPFCTLEIHKKPILMEQHGWFITESTWPYDHTAYHFLIISRAHKETITELSPTDLDTIFTLAQWAIDKFGIKGGSINLRFGDTYLNGATIKHLHFHLIVPEIDPATGRAKTVYFPIG